MAKGGTGREELWLAEDEEQKERGTRGGGGSATQGVHRRTGSERGQEDFVQGSAFRLGRRGRDCPLL